MTNARCPLLALSGQSVDTRKCPLSGASGHSLRSAKWFVSEFHLSARIEYVSLDRCGARCARARSTGTRRRVDHRHRARRCGRSRAAPGNVGRAGARSSSQALSDRGHSVACFASLGSGESAPPLGLRRLNEAASAAPAVITVI